ncbi:MAG TPA: UDP-glucose/GDP-mannose dehydrogenase family protein [Methylomusa anaerophila]|uniref:UDP-glucose 6-dehydrogenase n=1 Tax=Methylomusa anaerophila TaxID=1930071 RepID=A0A348AGD1_9FIRM|nr:UDP-glucose/GDP-mannose dehydrogenase family protein [Methylomusa anaerophila]BBB90129.1 UDP-glucose 6-dehydrogenase TuaD [Methylomusa anaerophila]HML88147.1 UDP-glucose/GDP-mannose dehydrogenase family protein [Methylomusa anaerophila]
MSRKNLKVCIVGTGYVGLTTGVCLAGIGHDVVCIDIDEKKIRMLKAGQSPIYEPGIEDLLKVAADKLSFTTQYTDCKDADVIILAVGTPSAKSGKADLSYMEAAVTEIVNYLHGEKFQVVVNKSTVPVGTAQRTEMIISSILHKQNRQANFAVASNPEFLREGLAVHDTFYPDRIVIGAKNTEALNSLRNMYAPLLEQTFAAPKACPRPEGFPLPALITTDVTSAEMIKYAANSFLATKISYINEISGLCEKVGADVTEVARGIGLDKRIGSRFLQAGVGWGGSCFGKDTAAIINTGLEYAYEMPIISAAVAVNKRQRSRMIEKLQESLKVVRGRTIGLLGLSFKPDTDDLRDAPALDIIRYLVEMGARVKAFDPIAMPNCKAYYPELAVEYTDDVLQLASGCDAVLLITEWDEFRRLPLEQLAERMTGSKVFVDGRNIVDPGVAQEAGLLYIGFGRSGYESGWGYNWRRFHRQLTGKQAVGE